ncbi:MaoC family dehydratase [Ornithinimicrobium faecis]|uniref:MaoC family dehydratase n=1 Tax=Ornithinimicrobium faecis TaxID=2934158 RepID=A0ABY4YXC7_9MICO|nr:MaoC family dehydratase [Ornithinimicrobium sp. HY1793]USQ81389.1 MaoC family dehydratase [Ornithinimicrobium sp. HY1793]
MRTFNTLSDLAGAVGEHLGHSDWIAVEQDMITAFGEVTGDQQWIHSDPARAASGPYGTTVAHGYLILSLLPVLTAQLYEVRGVSATINYGLDRVRFPSPVRVGSRIRVGAEIVSVEPGSGHATQAVVRMTVQVEGVDRPACVADTVRRFVPDAGGANG